MTSGDALANRCGASQLPPGLCAPCTSLAWMQGMAGLRTRRTTKKGTQRRESVREGEWERGREGERERGEEEEEEVVVVELKEVKGVEGVEGVGGGGGAACLMMASAPLTFKHQVRVWVAGARRALAQCIDASVTQAAQPHPGAAAATKHSGTMGISKAHSCRTVPQRTECGHRHPVTPTLAPSH